MDPLKSGDILRTVRKLEISTRKMVTDSLAGTYQSVFKGSGMNFDEVREYLPGDDIRSIDWNVTARTGVPHVKKFVEERELTIMLMIDISASGDFGSVLRSKRELMAELGSVLAFSAVRNNDKVGLILFSDFIELYIPPDKGRSHILRLIREILYYRPRGRKTDLGLPIDFVIKVCKRRAVTFLISDYCLPGDFDDQLAALKTRLMICNRRHDVISVVVNDPRERELPDCGRITIEDAETGDQVELNTSDRSVREQWGRMAEDRSQRLNHMLGTAGIDRLEVSTDRSSIEPLLGFFGARKRRLAR
ncbi:MAG: DUF58 domain-containing protein [Desulfofustis sp.]|nr:DUF58 domain-containing protein [Desulfofustis sp.]